MERSLGTVQLRVSSTRAAGHSQQSRNLQNPRRPEDLDLGDGIGSSQYSVA